MKVLRNSSLAGTIIYSLYTADLENAEVFYGDGMTEAPFKIYASDWIYIGSPEPGPDCLCSRCGKPILEAPIRAWPENGSYEYRYHPECLGFKSFPDKE